MPEPTKPIAVTAEFVGIQTNVDPRDLTAGAAEDQVNLTCVEAGELRLRQGIREVVFEQ